MQGRGRRWGRRIEARHDGGGECCFAAGIGQAEEHPASLAEARDQPGFSHQLQMTADARLALPQNLGEVLDVQLALGEQRKNAKPRGLSSGAQAAKGLGTRQAVPGTGWSLIVI